MWDAVAGRIAAAEGVGFRLRERTPVGGGCINQACCLSDGRRRFFVKFNAAGQLPMLRAEMAALTTLRACAALSAPRPVCAGETAGMAYLVLEWLELRGDGDARALGRALAAQHRCRGPGFGWPQDNFIGSTAQDNRVTASWCDFFATRRLGPQLDLLEHGDYARLADRGRRLVAALPAFLGSHEPAAALLHGDFWSGNYAYLEDASPVQFDPASYYGDRETDLAMSELFGGFSADFYAAYRESWPLDAGYELRRGIYNLYHLLNHVNLFGAGYAGQALATIDELLAQAG